MKFLVVCVSVVLFSSFVWADGLDCVKTVVYPQNADGSAGGVTTNTYRVYIVDGQALVNANSTDENGKDQTGDQFALLANYANGQFSPLRIVDRTTNHTKDSNGAQSALSTTISGYGIVVSCVVNSNEQQQ